MAEDGHKGGADARGPISKAARRALAEAEQRRQTSEARNARRAPPEIGGRDGPEPARFGDWEVKGVASDF